MEIEESQAAAMRAIGGLLEIKTPAGAMENFARGIVGNKAVASHRDEMRGLPIGEEISVRRKPQRADYKGHYTTGVAREAEEVIPALAQEPSTNEYPVAVVRAAEILPHEQSVKHGYPSDVAKKLYRDDSALWRREDRASLKALQDIFGTGAHAVTVGKVCNTLEQRIAKGWGEGFSSSELQTMLETIETHCGLLSEVGVNTSRLTCTVTDVGGTYRTPVISLGREDQLRLLLVASYGEREQRAGPITVELGEECASIAYLSLLEAHGLLTPLERQKTKVDEVNHIITLDPSVINRMETAQRNLAASEPPEVGQGTGPAAPVGEAIGNMLRKALPGNGHKGIS